ncbi:multiubiquitin domain-containing protein [Burkholderia gladioli]|uniref:multiubiquitin domain-containing protein n=1 Tax=Burkholderia gladioli TaxID=28095 RepID=UPI00163E1E03|nr:multiubiquitin domain-containing protein [Burkholderia gladioli]
MGNQEDLRRSYCIFVAFANTSFRKIEMDDPVPLGRQILTAAGHPADSDFSVYNILNTGDFEDVRLDEEIDLRRPGAERFIIFKADRDFKLTLNQRQLLWGLPSISGADLYALSNAGEDLAVYLVCPGADDRLIERGDSVDLTAPGVEHFITVKHPREFEIFINGRKTIVHDERVTFEQLVELAFPGVPPQPDVTYSITYRKVASFPHEGELAPGAFIDVKNGSIINVSRTIQS